MRFNTSGQSTEVVAPFQATHDAAMGMFLRNVFDALGHPHIVLLNQAQLAQIIFPMSVKSCTDKNEFRSVSL
jgi:hypothetical protein